MIPALAIPAFPLLLLAQPVPESVLQAWCEDRKAAEDVHAVRLCADWSSATGEDRASWADAVATLMRRGRLMSETARTPETVAPPAASRPDDVTAAPAVLPAATVPASPAATPAPAPPKPTPIPLPDTPLGRCLAEVPPGSWTSCGTSPIPLVKDGIRGNSGPRSVITAWNGAAFDAASETMYLTGGGHTDYGGTEIYAFHAPTLAWRVEKPHTGKLVILQTGGNGRCAFVHDDGTPSARHTYDGINFIDGKIVVAGGSFFCPHGPARGDGNVYTYDLESKAYDHPMGTMAIGDISRTKSGYDRENGILIVSGQDNLRTIRDWQILDHRRGLNSWAGVATFLRSRHLYLLIDSLGLRAFPISPDGAIGAPARLLPAPEVAAFKDAGLAEIEDGSLVIWPGGTTLHALDTSAWSIRQYGNPDGRGPSNNGRIYSKFAYLPAHRALMGYNNAAQPVWFYRLAGDGTMPASDLSQMSPDLDCDDRVRTSACPDLQKLLAGGGEVRVPKGVYLQCATLARPGNIDFNGAMLRGVACGGKAALIVRADMKIRNLECSEIRVGDGNGACIRQESGTLELDNVHFHDSQEGVLTGTGVSGLTIRNSRFERLGGDCRRRCGQAHGVYYGAPTGTLEIVASRFSAPRDEGHLVKSGAARLIVRDTELDERDGKGSRSIDAFNGGELVIRNSRIRALRGDGNWEVIGYNRERRHAHPIGRIEIRDSEIDCAGGPLLGGPLPDDIVETGNRFSNCRDRPER